MSTLIAQTVLRAALRRGSDLSLLMQEVGLEPEVVEDPEEVLPLEAIDALWCAAASRVGTAFGLDVAQHLERGALRGLEYAIRASSTLGDGLHTLVRFTRILHATGGYELRPELEGGATLVYDAPHAEPAEQLAVDFALAAVTAITRDATGVRWRPRRVRFRHVAVKELPAYSAFFDAPVQLHQPENAIQLDAELLALPMRDSDSVLREVLERYLRSELASLEPVQSLADTVGGVILDALPQQAADLESVAARIGLSPRVLQKRLQQSGTSFQALLDRVRESVAKRHLLEPTVSLAGAARELGYSDVTAFHRAFKRWTGVTPGEFRRRAMRNGSQPGRTPPYELP